LTLPEYTQWSTSELKQWLEDHDISVPSTDSFSHEHLQELVKSNWNSASAWTYDRYTNAQKSFADVRDSTFDAWDESRLREFLLEQGVVAPQGPREQLVLLAKSKYRAYTDAASSFSAQASTAVYGDKTYQMSKTLSSIVAQATKDAARAADDGKDYVYSAWDDNKLRTYLEDQGMLKTKTEKKREELLAMMRDVYTKVTDPIWKAWSTSYIVSSHTTYPFCSHTDVSLGAHAARMAHQPRPHQIRLRKETRRPRSQNGIVLLQYQ
jgi:hypothetical protein